MHELRAAWQTWWSGQSAVDLPLWGKNVLFWGRLGKITEFVAALAILAEVVGETRLHHAAASLRHFTIRKAVASIGEIARSFLPYLLYLLRPLVPVVVWPLGLLLGQEHPLSQRLSNLANTTGEEPFFTTSVGRKSQRLLGVVVLGWAVVAIPLLVIAMQRDIRAWEVRSALGAGGDLLWQWGKIGLTVLFLTPIAVAVISLLVGVANVIARPVLLGIAWVLAQEAIENQVKVLSVLLLALGFHFDLLAT
jgi:hypothetical protein